MISRAKEVKIIEATKAEDKSKLRVAAYCRVSTDSADQVNSFFAQVRYYNDYIRQNENMVLVDVYADEGITGTVIQKRDEFKRLLKDCKNKKIDRVLVKSVTRFARNSLECIESVRIMKSCGVSVFFENDNLDTEQMNSEMILYIKSAFAQNEVMSASKRMQTSVRMKMEDGSFITTKAPYGYRLINGKLEIDQAEAAIVKEIFRLYLSGYGINVILTKIQSIEPETLKWSIHRINYILSNERYIGDSMYQKFYTPSVIPFKLKTNRGELPKYYCEGTHDAIISKAVFYRVQEMLKSKSKSNEIINSNQFYYKKIYCRHCSWAYKKIKRASGEYWVCSKKGLPNNECHAPSFSDYNLDSAFVKMFNILRQNEKIILEETIAQLNSLKNKISRGNNAISEIDIEIASLGEQKRTYSELHASHVIDEVIYLEKVDKIQRQITELRSRRLKLLNEDEEEVCLENLRKLKRVLSGTKEFMRDINRELFKQIVEKVYIEENGSITFRLKCELELNVGGK